MFRSPARASLEAKNDEKAKKINQKHTGKSLPNQTLAILPKIKEVDELLRDDGKARAMIREVHPELCFYMLAGGRPMKHPKRKKVGADERVAVLNRLCPSLGNKSERIRKCYRSSEAKKDDILDAMAAAVTALVCADELRTIPESSPKDSCDLPMEMVYYKYHCPVRKFV